MEIVLVVFIVCVLAVAMYFIGRILKNVLFPPCIKCKHCKYDWMYTLPYRCCKNLNRVDAKPYSCTYYRGGIRCWFEKKQ